MNKKNTMSSPLLKTAKNFEKLLDSIAKHDTSSLKTLIQEGVDVNGYEDTAKIRPLHYAVQFGFLEGVAILINSGANPKAATSDGETSLDLARLYKNGEIIQLIEKQLSVT